MTYCPALEFQARVAELEAEEDRIGYWTDEASALRDRQAALWAVVAKVEPISIAGAVACGLALADQLQDGPLADALRPAARQLLSEPRTAAWKLLALMRQLPAGGGANGLSRFLKRQITAIQD